MAWLSQPSPGPSPCHPGKRPIGTYPRLVASVGIFPVDASSVVGKVRILMADNEGEALPEQPGLGTYVFFGDEEILAMLSVQAGSPHATAAALMRNIAFSKSLKLLKFSSADLMVDGPSITNALLKAADAIERSGAAAAEAGTEGFRMVRLGGGVRLDGIL